MQDERETYFSRLDPKKLTSEQWAAIKQNVLRRAKAERDELVRQVIITIGTLPHRIVAFFIAWQRARKQRRIKDAAVAELRALDDVMLKDMGINRTQIHSAVHFAAREAAECASGRKDARVV